MYRGVTHEEEEGEGEEEVGGESSEVLIIAHLRPPTGSSFLTHANRSLQGEGGKRGRSGGGNRAPCGIPENRQGPREA